MASQVLVILDTLTINQTINVIKRSEIDKLSVSLNGSRISHLLACHWAELSIKSKTAVNHTMDLTNLMRLLRWLRRRKLMLFLQRSYMPELRTCSWATTCIDDAGPGGGGWFPHASQAEHHEYLYQDGYREQASSICGEESDHHSDHHC